MGLTGGIASGKSTVAAHLRSLGAWVVDADRLAREAVEPGSPVLRGIVEAFGSEVLAEDGSLNRRALADRVFGDPQAVSRLNALVHPEVRRRIEACLAEARRRAVPVAVLEAPLLLEAGLDRLCQAVWVVAVPEAVQVARLRQRSGYTEEEARRRIASQWPLARRLARATAVIWNTGPWEETRREVDRLWRELTEGLGRR